MRFVLSLLVVVLANGCGEELHEGRVAHVKGVVGVLNDCAGNPSPFVTVWNVNEAQTIVLPIVKKAEFEIIVDWGDGSPIEEVSSAERWDASHQYASAGLYTIKIAGNIGKAWNFKRGNRDSADNVVSVADLGSVGWLSLGGAFYGLPNLTDVVGGCTEDVTDMSHMFEKSINVTPDTSTYNTSSVEDMTRMFYGAYKATPDTSGWKTSQVRNMSSMFKHAHMANPNVSGWDTSRVRDMSSMFAHAMKVNPDVVAWDTSQVRYMIGMFERASLANPDVSYWDVSNVLYMSWMFERASLANPDVSYWDTASLSDVEDMFRKAYSADPDISNWDTSNLSHIEFLFYDAESANPDFSNWDFSNIIHMYFMFSANNSFDVDNYSAFLKRLADTPEYGGLQDDVTKVAMYVGDVKYYHDAEPAKRHLETLHDFILMDGGETQQ